MVERIEGAVRELIIQWYDRAQIDYNDLYVRLYISYNAWFRQVTHTSFDREAISRLKKRFVIWDDYINGQILQDLEPIAEQIVISTHQQPLGAGSRWNGIVDNSYDWRGLIHFWYQVRCDLFHGSAGANQVLSAERVRLAYESLGLYMQEITDRMKGCFTEEDYDRLLELQRLSTDSSDDTTRQHLYQKFIHSPDIWNVDMIRVGKAALPIYVRE